MKNYVLLVILIFFCGFVQPSIFETTSSWFNSTSQSLFAYINKKFEWCSDDHVPYQLHNLQNMFDNKLYGQHIAADIVLNAIISHLQILKPKKPLVMSFHGANGIGKTYVSRMIAQALYERGDRSTYFHFFYGLQNFPLIEKLSDYREQLTKDIKAAISKCEKSLFVFDGLEQMPSGLLDVLIPFIDCPHCGEKTENNKSIFLLLTNVGSLTIQNHLLEKVTKGESRESTTLQDFEKLLISEANNRTGGLFHSLLIKYDSIDFYIPFLPLEKHHVTYCIQEAFKELNTSATKDLIDTVFQELRFGPEPENLFSKSGCKRVAQITGRIIAKFNLNHDFSNKVNSYKTEF